MNEKTSWILPWAVSLALGTCAACTAADESRAVPRSGSESVPEMAPERREVADVLRPAQCGAIARLHEQGGVLLASQPTPADLEIARASGVRTVLNLRHPEEIDFDEAAVAEGLGLAYVNLPWNGPEELTDAVFDRAREVLRTADRPLLFHCGSANRAATLWIAHRALDGGLDLEAAVAEAKTVGLTTPAFEAKARDYVARHGG